jgi:WD40 repeat protein/Tfp pilus assembly protein PilF
LTLYELLTLRPAFDDTNKARLIEKVLHEPAISPRRLDPRVPRDLETVVLKSVAKDPAERYATAEEMAEDLRRFLADRPICARRASPAERVWRWCRRNRRAALMTAALAVLGLVTAVGLPVGVLLNRQRQEALDNLARAQKAEEEAQLAGRLASARAHRYSGEVGQRFLSLDDLAAAARLRPSLELRNEAIACLVLADLRLTRSASVGAPGMTRLKFDAAFERYASSDGRGQLSVRRAADGAELLSFPGPGTHAFFLEFGPGGRYLAAIYHHQPLHVWDLERGQLAWKSPAHTGAVAFSRDGNLVAVAPDDRTLDVRDAATGRTTARLAPGTGVGGFAFDPSGTRLAVCTALPRAVQVFDLATEKVRRTLAAPAAPKQPAWRPDGQLLAAAAADDLLYVWNVDTGQVQAVLRGHNSRPTELSFTPEGDLLASSGWDNALRLWDPLTGRQVLSLPGVDNARQLPADRCVGLGLVGTTAEVWEVAHQEFCRTAAGPAGAGGVWSAGFSKDGRLLVFLCGGNSVHLWDWRAGREIASWPVVNDAVSVHIHPDDNSLLISGRRGLHRWPVRTEAGGGRSRLRVGPPELLVPGSLGPAALSADGRALAAVNLNRSEVVVHDLHEHKTRVLGRHEGAYHTALSPDGSWAASAVWRGQACPIKVKVWNAHAGECARSLGTAEVGGDAQIQFTGDGRWLVITTGQEYRFWRTGTWEPGRELALERGGTRTVALGAARDGSLLAVARARSAVQLLDSAGNELATLTCPERQEVFGMQFSPDGRLLAVRCDNRIVHVWDLARLREELGKLGLDWDASPYSPAPGPDEEPAPLTAAVDLGDPPKPVAKPAADPKQLVERYTEKLKANPDDAESYHLRAHAYERLRQYERAIEDFTAALERLPNNAHFYEFRGKDYQAVKDHVRAVADWKKSLELNPRQAQLCNNLAWLLLTGPAELRDPEAALALARKAVDLSQGRFLFHNTLGLALYRNGLIAEAVPVLERSLAARGGESDAYDLFFLAMCHARLGDAAGGKDFFERAVRWTEAQKNLDAQHAEELKAFRAEAEAVLNGK